MSKILVIDDDEDMLHVAEVLFTMNGFIVKTIVNAGECMNAIESFNPDIILLDITLGGHDGREICRNLKNAGSPYKHIPVILFSARHDLQRQFRECKANDFVAKPFETKSLVETVRKHSLSAA